MLCVFGQLGASIAAGQVEAPGDPGQPPAGVGVQVTTEPHSAGSPPVYRLAITGDPSTAGPVGAFYRTTRLISQARVIEVDPPAGRAIPAGSNTHTQLVLWNERGDDGKLWPQRAIRQAGSHPDSLPDGSPALGNWQDANADGIADLGFVAIGPIDYRVMLRFAEFNPVGVSSAAGNPLDPPSEPWPVGEAPVPSALSAAAVPAYDIDGDGVPDPTGFAHGGCHLYIVQFWTQPLDEFRAALAAAGGTIEDFLAWNGYIVRVPDDAARAAIAGLACVRWVGAFHPAYRVDPDVRAALFDGVQTPDPNPVRYNIQVCERGVAQKNAVAQRIEAAGGAIEEFFEEGFRMGASLTPSQLESVLRMDETQFADRWSPAGEDMNNVRNLGGADYIESLGSPHFDGTGIRGEVMDQSMNLSHEAFQSADGVLVHGMSLTDPDLHHGTSTYGIVFGDGTDNPLGRGLLPGANHGADAVGRGIFATWHNLTIEGGPMSRYTETAELVGYGTASTNLRASFQSNSWGSAIGSCYTTVSAEMDDILFLMDIPVIQSQGDHGTSPDCDNRFFSGIGSREQAWAKNNVSVGSVFHYDNSNDLDDYWHSAYHAAPTWSGSGPAPCVPDGSFTCAGSAGPASDGRVKPDMVFYNDSILTPGWGSGWMGPDVYTCQFNGTSAAAPAVAGYFGLMLQMWHQEVFPGFGGGPTAFDDRPHMTTAKALMVNSAFQYPLPPTHDITRDAQGWGRPDMRSLYDMRERLLIVDESEVLTPLASASVSVLAEHTTHLKATLVYADPKGDPASPVAVVNKLNLEVVSPTGVVYWGNHGLDASNWSSSGGLPDKVNTVENVFIDQPEDGYYSVIVTAADLAEDGHVETQAVDADFALVVSGIVQGSPALEPGWKRPPAQTIADFYSFIQSFVEGDADFNGDGRTTDADLYAFLDAFLAGDRKAR